MLGSLIREVKLQPILSHLHAALASPASNETISEDLFDMIGYDDMDMIVEILDKRAHIAAEVNPTFTFSQRASVDVNIDKLEIALKRPQDPTPAIDGHSVPGKRSLLSQRNLRIKFDFRSRSQSHTNRREKTDGGDSSAQRGTTIV